MGKQLYIIIVNTYENLFVQDIYQHYYKVHDMCNVVHTNNIASINSKIMGINMC